MPMKGFWSSRSISRPFIDMEGPCGPSDMLSPCGPPMLIWLPLGVVDMLIPPGPPRFMLKLSYLLGFPLEALDMLKPFGPPKDMLNWSYLFGEGEEEGVLKFELEDGVVLLGDHWLFGGATVLYWGC